MKVAENHHPAPKRPPSPLAYTLRREVLASRKVEGKRREQVGGAIGVAQRDHLDRAVHVAAAGETPWKSQPCHFPALMLVSEIGVFLP